MSVDYQRLETPIPPTADDEIVIAPQPGPQTAFLSCDADIVVYGGAAGGGKTWGLLLDVLRYAALEPVEGFGAVIFRRTAPQITAQGGLWDESSKLYPIVGGKPNKTMYSWDWPQHSTRIRFAHMQYEQNMYNWQGSQIAYLGYDELTHFSETAFFYMLSRNRSTCGVKPQVRATVNPDPDSWVKTFLAPWVDPDWERAHGWRAEGAEVLRFYRDSDTTHWLRADDVLPAGIEPERIKTATFIPAKLSDNPALLRANPDYYANLMALPAIERERLLGGPLAWTLRHDGNTFKRQWFTFVDAAPVDLAVAVRRWDFAATEPRKGYPDPDYTAGVKLGMTAAGEIYVLDCILERLSPADTQTLVQQTAALDGSHVHVRWEQEPGSAGKMVTQMVARLLAGYDARGVRSTGDKLTRALPFAAQAEAGNVKVVRGAWNEAWLNQLCAFPSPLIHDDAVDGTTGGYQDIAQRGVTLGDLQRRAVLRQQVIADQHGAATGNVTLAHPGAAAAAAAVSPAGGEAASSATTDPPSPPSSPSPDGFNWPW